MYKFLISQYINKMTKEDIVKFATKNGIVLNEKELDVIYINLKQNWETALYKDPSNLFQSLKQQLSKESYEKGIELYYKYYELYKNYL